VKSVPALQAGVNAFGVRRDDGGVVMAARVRIVLVEPREAGNVGAVARAMKNFGFRDLVIVGEHPPLLPVSGWWASGADDVIAEARFTGTLLEAIAGAHVTVATTSSRGRNLEPDLAPAGVAALRAQLTEQQTIALVFGREDRGLTTDETSVCQRTAIIPSIPGFPTMNLAQSVCIFAYELSRTELPVESTPRTLADAALVERLHDRAQALLTGVGFLNEKSPERIYRELRALAGRAELTERETTLLLGIVSQLEWRLGPDGKS
jgi:RNA methyltransferase, TrmH family, group 1